MYPKLSVTVVFLFLTSQGATADDIVLESGGARTSVLELYTSEGCSSCPPADRYFSRLVDHPRLWSEIIPLAFHVDYWDYIGWQDRFAKPGYGRRQYSYAETGAVRTVYTPGLFLDGAEWRGSRSEWPKTGASDSAGQLIASIGNSLIEIEFDQANIRDAVAKVALLGFGIGSSVDAGENKGRMLSHDFVVLEGAQAKMRRTTGGLAAQIVTPESAHKTERKAIAVWIEVDGQPSPVQAVGGWLN